MTQAPTPNNPMPRKAGENPLAATLLAAVLLNQGAQHGDKEQTEQGKTLLNLAEAAKGKMPKIPADSRIGKALKELAKTAVSP
jgi:hypothetical protein